MAEVNEIFRENKRLREELGLQPSSDDDSALVSARLSQLERENENIRFKLRKGKKMRCWGNMVLALLAVTLLLALAVTITLHLAKSDSSGEEVTEPEEEESPSMSSSLVQLPVSFNDPLRPNNVDELSPERTYNFNVGVQRNFQECQGSRRKQSFPDLDYALLGYNILKGYPLAVGHDPGFTLPIFSADYSAGGQTADCRYSTPKGVLLIPDVSCITSFSSQVLESSYEFSKALKTSVSAEGGGWGVSFSASADYKSAASEISTKQSVFIISKANCNYYFMRLLEEDAPPFHPLFMKWILKLNRTNQEEDYFGFLETYGTHFLSEVKFGASFTYEHKMTASKYKAAKSSQINVAASASYSGLFSVGGGFSMDASQREQASSFQKNVTTRTITVGAAPPANGDAMTWASTVKESPVPVTYSLKSIDELFSDTFMGTPSFRRYNIDFGKIAEKLVNFRSKYCEILKANGVVDDCEEITPGITLEHTLIYDTIYTTLFMSYSVIKAVSSSACAEECLRKTNCPAVSFCTHCHKDEPKYQTCIMFDRILGSLTMAGRVNGSYESTIITSNLKKPIMFRDTDILGIERTRNNITEPATAQECSAECLNDLFCVAFTFCSCPFQPKKCYLYSYRRSGGHLSLTYKTGVNSYFISRQGQNAESSTTTTTTAMTTTSTSVQSSA